MPLFDMTSFANVCMCEMQPLVKHGCFKVCDTLKIIEDVGFHVFKALKKDDITCVFNGTSFFNTPTILLTTKFMTFVLGLFWSNVN